jgi:hypothetical protein
LLPFFRDASAARRYDICTIQGLFGHKGVNRKMIYTRVLNKGRRGAKSPAEEL